LALLLLVGVILFLVMKLRNANIHLSSDYHIIGGDQTPMNKKGGLPTCSELAKPALKLAELTTAYPESARSTAFAAYPEPTRPTS
jgi:hypothetical protein